MHQKCERDVTHLPIHREQTKGELPLNLSFCFDGELGEHLARSVMQDMQHSAFSTPFRLYYQLRGLIPIGFRRGMQGFRNRYLNVANQWYIPSDLEEVLHTTGLSRNTIWPNASEFALVLTHDVEEQKGFDYILKVADEEEKLGLRSCWNLVPYKYRIDAGAVQELKDRGHEIAVHGYNHDGRLFLSESMFRSRLTAINEAIERFGAVGFRAEMVHRNLSWMQSLNIDYDASCFDVDPFQAMPGGVGCIWPFQVGRFIELPYTMPQDHTLFLALRETTTRIWQEKFAFLRKHHGMVMMLTHPDYLSLGTGLKLYQSFLKSVVEEGGAWHALPREVACWYRTKYVAG